MVRRYDPRTWATRAQGPTCERPGRGHRSSHGSRGRTVGAPDRHAVPNQVGHTPPTCGRLDGERAIEQPAHPARFRQGRVHIGDGPHRRVLHRERGHEQVGDDRMVSGRDATRSPPSRCHRGTRPARRVVRRPRGHLESGVPARPAHGGDDGAVVRHRLGGDPSAGPRPHGARGGRRAAAGRSRSPCW